MAAPRGDKENRAINGNDLTDTSFRPLAGIKKIVTVAVALAAVCVSVPSRG